MLSMCITLSALYLNQAFCSSPEHCAKRRNTDKCQYTIKILKTAEYCLRDYNVRQWGIESFPRKNCFESISNFVEIDSIISSVVVCITNINSETTNR
uniref:Secreted protein n=1 Tax=Glyptapanteles indiensis TaxID=92994 RepID=A0JCV1_GLYIN|nr:hypothetical protein GIP_L1_00220 [Glyptapanteles indiensis]